MGQHQCTYTMFGRVDFKWKVKDVMDYGRKTLFSIHLDCEKDERKWTNSFWAPHNAFPCKDAKKMTTCFLIFLACIKAI